MIISYSSSLIVHVLVLILDYQIYSSSSLYTSLGFQKISSTSSYDLYEDVDELCKRGRVPATETKVMLVSKPNGMSEDEIINAIKVFKRSSNAAVLPHVIGKASVENFNAVLAMEDRPRCKLDYKNGEIIIVEIPTGGHEGAIENAREQVSSALSTANGFRRSGSTTYITTTGSVIEPDGSWYKRRLPGKEPSGGGTFSGELAEYELKVVLEIGYSQTLAALQRKAEKWLTETSCREVILIDISRNREVLRGEIWRRNRLDNPVQTEDFSNVGSANAQFLYLDLRNIYDNAIWDIPQFFRDPQRFPGLTVPIDLYLVRLEIQE